MDKLFPNYSYPLNNYNYNFEIDDSVLSSSFSDTIQASAILPYNDDYLKINWENSPTVNGWTIYCREGSQDFFDGNKYNYFKILL